MAFSPGFVSSDRDGGRPRAFVAHGTEDAVLPIGSTSRVIVPRLRREGVAVRYEEFDGPHTVPRDAARQAIDWFLSGG